MEVRHYETLCALAESGPSPRFPNIYDRQILHDIVIHAYWTKRKRNVERDLRNGKTVNFYMPNIQAEQAVKVVCQWYLGKAYSKK